MSELRPSRLHRSRSKPLRLGVVAVAALALVAAACSSGTTNTATSAGGTTAEGAPVDPALCPVNALDGVTSPVEISFWWAVPGGEVGETIERYVDEYNASQQRVRVKLVKAGSYNENLDKYISASESPDQLPALAQFEDTATQYLIDSGTTVPVAACVQASSFDLSPFLPRVVDFYTVADVLWGMPFNVSNPILFYSKKAFADAGLNPDVGPATFVELEQFSRQIVSSGAAKYGFAFGLQPWEWIEQQFALASQLYVDHENGRVSRAEKVLFDNSLGQEVMTFLKSTVDQGLAVNVGRNLSGQDALLKLIDPSEPAAMTVNSTAALGTVYSILETQPDLAARIGDVGVAPLPRVQPGDGGVMVGGGSLWLMAEKSPQETAAAWDFITWLTTAQRIADWSAATGYIPIRTDSVTQPVIQDLWARRPAFKVPYDQLVQGAENPGSAGPVIGPYRQIREIMVIGMERMFLNNLDPNAMLTEVAAESDQALAAYTRQVGG